MLAAIMIIYFGAANTAQFDVEKYDNMAQCENAKVLIAARYKGKMYGPSADDIKCLEIPE